MRTRERQSSYTAKVRAMLPLAYWPMADAGGAVVIDESRRGLSGAYAATTLGAAGIGDGRSAAVFNGSSAYANIYSTLLQTVFGALEGTLMGWGVASAAGVWSDGTARQICRIRFNNNSNILLLRKSGTANTFTFYYQTQTTVNSYDHAIGAPATWQHYAITWSKNADQVKAFLNGAQVGSTMTGLGVFDKTQSITNSCAIGAATTGPSEVWSGSIAHVALWDRALSAQQISQLATVA